MSSTFELSHQELGILLTAMQCMTNHQESQADPSKIAGNLYDKLHTRYEYLQRIQQDYEHDI